MTERPQPLRFPLLAAGILGLTGVALGAIGAHALRAPLLERGMTVSWEAAARYHMIHAVALLGLAAWLRAAGPADRIGAMLWAARAWVLGVVLFSGSLYGLALGGPRWLGPITPFGGISLLVGWALVGAAAFPKK
jgi:uncharacterized membrane protein YgdD (TMEM256/DUF423 family)